AVRGARCRAGTPTAGGQPTVRALGAPHAAARAHAFAQAPHLIALGNLPPARQAELFSARRPNGFRVR
ncbi:enoyl-CoA hydratase/isomerase family protein, partial [Streptomyces sp. NPDC127044]